MNKLLLILSCIFIICGSIFLSHVFTKNKHIANTGNIRNELASIASKPNPKNRTYPRIGDYYKWQDARKCDPATGVFNYTAFHAALAQFEEIAGNNGNTRAMAPLGLDFESLGSTSQGGRSRAVLVDKDDPDRMYLGSVGGGLYYSNNRGASWQPSTITDAIPTLPIGSLGQDIDGHIYVGTGENVNNSSCLGGISGAINGMDAFPGNGIYKSTDGGETFSSIVSTVNSGDPSEAYNYSFVNRIACNKTSKKIYAATNSGLRVSTDGANFTVASAGDFYDVDIAATDDNVIWAVKEPALLMRSTDGGATFTTVTIPSAGVGSRKELSISPQDPNYVYVVNVSNCLGILEGVYRTTDGGVTWEKIGYGGSDTFDPMSNAVQAQGTYDLAIAVDPLNKNRCIVGGVQLWSYADDDGWRSIDIWNFDDPFNPYYVHADKHNIYFHPTIPSTMYVVSDGGLYATSDAQSLTPTFYQRNNNYNTLQAYHIAASYEGWVVCGTQDNGTQLVNYSQYSPYDSDELQGGDGGYVEISKLKDGAYFAANPDGKVFRSSNYGGSWASVFDCLTDFTPANSGGGCGGDGILDGGGQFVQPYLLWEDNEDLAPTTTDTARFILANNAGTVFMTNRILDFGILPPTYWVTLGNLPGAIVASHFQMSRDGDRLYVSSTNGGIYRFSGINAGTYPITPVQIGNIGGSAMLALDKESDGNDQLVVMKGGYDAIENHVYYGANAQTMTTSSTMSNFTDIHNSGLPTMPIYSGVINYYNDNQIIIGSELGVWSCDITTLSSPIWSYEGGDLGPVPTYCVRQEQMNNTQCYVLYFGTHGRGMWRSTTLTPSIYASDYELPLPTVGITESNINNFSMTIAPNPISNIAIINIHNENTADITISVIDINGKIVKKLELNRLTHGNHSIPFLSEEFANGTYFISAASHRVMLATEKVIIAH